MIGLVLRRAATTDLAAAELDSLHAFLVRAFGDDPDDVLRDDDWQHALGGTHVLLEEDGAVVAHAAVVERTIEVGDRALRTGYVEAVATRADRRRAGLGSIVMRDVAEVIRAGFELGMLGTGVQPFYERLGWRVWAGPSGVRESAGGIRWTPDEDGYLMVLETPRTPAIDPASAILCGPRSGDDW
ncbi:MAG TPA: GNAT family N-acetyltransferase [Candidatus Limnocylindrales bacterium]|nr:GNAT family N-acetyltransferase [Candidatus Limnocylindrales bacterium]